MIEVREHRLPGPPENPCKEWGVYLDDVLLFTSKLSCDATLGKKQLENYIRKEIQAFALNFKSMIKCAADFGRFEDQSKYPEYVAIEVLKEIAKAYNLEGLI